MSGSLERLPGVLKVFFWKNGLHIFGSPERLPGVFKSVVCFFVSGRMTSYFGSSECLTGALKAVFSGKMPPGKKAQHGLYK